MEGTEVIDCGTELGPALGKAVSSYTMATCNVEGLFGVVNLDTIQILLRDIDVMQVPKLAQLLRRNNI